VDDAAGECFDKVAKLLGFDYPGGPMISKFAADGDTKRLSFPRPMLKEKNFDFSFAGLKTSALYWLRDNELAATKTTNLNLPTGITGIPGEPPTINDFCASFEQAITDVLVGKTMRAVEKFKPKTVILAGGVSANKKLRETLESEIKNYSSKIKFLRPEPKYCMDNAAMIAVAGYARITKETNTSWREINADPNWEIEE
jgi:N6-L-threonylcarbamoyladenine synthase